MQEEYGNEAVLWVPQNRQEEYGNEGADPPGHDTGSLCQAPFQDLIPTNQLLALGCQEAVDAADEPGLQLVLILQLLLLDALLTCWAAAPSCLGALHPRKHDYCSTDTGSAMTCWAAAIMSWGSEHKKGMLAAQAMQAVQ